MTAPCRSEHCCAARSAAASASAITPLTSASSASTARRRASAAVAAAAAAAPSAAARSASAAASPQTLARLERSWCSSRASTFCTPRQPVCCAFATLAPASAFSVKLRHDGAWRPPARMPVRRCQCHERVHGMAGHRTSAVRSVTWTRCCQQAGRSTLAMPRKRFRIYELRACSSLRSRMMPRYAPSIATTMLTSHACRTASACAHHRWGINKLAELLHRSVARAHCVLPPVRE